MSKTSVLYFQKKTLIRFRYFNYSSNNEPLQNLIFDFHSSEFIVYSSTVVSSKEKCWITDCRQWKCQFHLLLENLEMFHLIVSIWGDLLIVQNRSKIFSDCVWFYKSPDFNQLYSDLRFLKISTLQRIYRKQSNPNSNWFQKSYFGWVCKLSRLQPHREFTENSHNLVEM